MNNNELQRTGEMLLPSIAYGDAAGVPVETKSFDYIKTHHGRLNRLIEATDNVYFKGEYAAGTTSDDTQLSIAVTKALLRADGFDLRALADEHIVAYSETPEYTLQSGRIKKLGWGASTTTSIQRIIEGVSPLESGSKEGTGNGVLMKMAPLVYWQYTRCLSDKQRYQQYDQLTAMTHDTDVAKIATRVHGDALYGLLLEEFNEKKFGRKVWELAGFHEDELGHATSDVSDSLKPLVNFYRPSVEQVRKWYADRAYGSTDKEFGKSYGFYAPETLAIAYGALRLGDGDYHKTVYTAANLGGDADSAASIAGAMVNFVRKGEQEMPDDIEAVKDIENLRRLSKEFSQRALAS